MCCASLIVSRQRLSHQILCFLHRLLRVPTDHPPSTNVFSFIFSSSSSPVQGASLSFVFLAFRGAPRLYTRTHATTLTPTFADLTTTTYDSLFFTTVLRCLRFWGLCNDSLVAIALVAFATHLLMLSRIPRFVRRRAFRRLRGLAFEPILAVISWREVKRVSPLAHWHTHTHTHTHKYLHTLMLE